MLKVKWRRLLPVILFLSVTACTSSPKTTRVIEPEVNLKVEPAKALQIVDPASKVVGTANSVQVRDIRTSSVNNQLLVQVELNNNRGRRDAFDYRVRWLDANGLQVVPYASWEVVSLEGQESSVLNLTSPRTDATDFRFEIKAHY